MDTHILEILFMLGLFAFGAPAGMLLGRCYVPLAGWAALAFSLVLVPLGFALTISFC